MKKNVLYKVYVHRVINDDLYYVGITSRKTHRRFINNEYKTCSLFQFLNPAIPLRKNPNIETLVVSVEYDYHKAKEIEDVLISFYRNLGKAINKIGSGDNCYTAEYRKKYYKNNRETIQKQRKERYRENKTKIQLQKKQNRERHKEEIAERGKVYYKENRDKILEYQKQYRDTHVEELKAKRKERYQKNAEEIKRKMRERRRLSTPQYDNSITV